MLDVEKLNSGINKYAAMLGIEFLSFGEGRCRAQIEIRDDHLHPGMIVHGGWRMFWPIRRWRMRCCRPVSQTRIQVR